MVFSDTVLNLGIVQQARGFARVDATQWPTFKIVASCNNYLDEITGYAIGADKRFAWDDTNHTKLPIGTTGLIANQEDYSFLTDEQGNKILTLTRLDLLQSDGSYRQLIEIDQYQIQGAIDQYQKIAGTPCEYLKIADNIVRLKPKPSATLAAGLQFHFQRTANYFAATDTTKEPGVATLLHRGFVIASAYDAALTLGLQNLVGLANEMTKERTKMIQYFADRNRDVTARMGTSRESNR